MKEIDKTKVLYSSFSPVATVEGAITDGLCQVVRLYMFAAFQVGNGACYLQDAVVGAGRETDVPSPFSTC